MTMAMANFSLVVGRTVDGRNPAPPKKPRNDDSPVLTNKLPFA